MKENLAELRETNSGIEHSRDAAERHLASKEMELEKARSTVNEMEREICILKDRCNGLVHYCQCLLNFIEENKQCHWIPNEKNQKIQTSMQYQSNEYHPKACVNPMDTLFNMFLL